MIETTASKLGSLDTLINNAGIAPMKPLLETSEADRRRVLDINVHGGSPNADPSSLSADHWARQAS